MLFELSDRDLRQGNIFTCTFVLFMLIPVYDSEYALIPL